MEKAKAQNDLNSPTARLCRLLEEHRRTAEGAIRTSQEFLQHFFPHDDKEARDLIFVHLPPEVRGPILAAWGIRGTRMAMRDTDEKVRMVVHDALVAGDLDPTAFEQSLSVDLLNKWVPLPLWWSFWRGGKQTKRSIFRAFDAAYQLSLIDARWFLDHLETKGAKARGTDVIAEGLTKADLSEWVKKIHQLGDGSPKGILETLGWEKLVQQTANEALLAVLDLMATKLHLAEISAPAIPAKQPSGNPTSPTTLPPIAQSPSSRSSAHPSKPPLAEDEIDELLDLQFSEVGPSTIEGVGAGTPAGGMPVADVVHIADDGEPQETTAVENRKPGKG